MKRVELKVCPFCGNKPNPPMCIKKQTGSVGLWEIQCVCDNIKVQGNQKNIVIAIWNTRK